MSKTKTTPEDILDAVCDGLITDLSDPDRRTPGVYQVALKLIERYDVGFMPIPGSKMNAVKTAAENFPFKTGTTN